MTSRAQSRSERLLLRKRSLAEALLARTCFAESEDSREPGDAIRTLNRLGRERLLADGAPVRQDEYWKYTDPLPLIGEGSHEWAPVRESPFDDISGPRIMVQGDTLDLEGTIPGGLEISRLRSTASGSACQLNGTCTAVQLPKDPVPRPLAALNAAAALDGVLIRATERVSVPVCLLLESEPRGGIAFSRATVHVEPGASLELLEFDRSGSVRNSAIEARVEEGGRLDHVRIQLGEARRETANAFVWLGAGAAYAGFTLTLDGELTRNETVLNLAGDGSAGHVAGGMLGAGTAHLDTTVLVIHSAEGCESRQVVRGVFDGRARGVFQGKVLVEQAAQKTDGYQISQAVLLDERAEFSSKPELEIYADDVKCSHGSTAGALDPEALFYLRSRGLEKHEAEAILIAAFLEQAFDEIRSPAAAEAVRAVSAAWMMRRQGATAP